MLYSLHFPAWNTFCLYLFAYPNFLNIQNPGQMSPPAGSSQSELFSSSMTLNAHHLLVQTHFTHLSSHKMASSSRAQNISGSSLYHIPTTIHSALHMTYACKT